MLTYQKAEPEDIGTLFLLNKQLIEEFEDLASIDYDKVLRWVRRNLEQNLSFFTRIYWDGKLAGYYCLLPNDGKMELDSLFVLSPFRGRGIGTAVLKKCQAETPLPIFLYVFRRNIQALSLYERLGFQTVKEVGSTRYIMEYQKQDC